ncbi:aminotransferase class V-fold PLP-dependent enzyme, partial [Cyclobacteriaceae bacterium]|nr:aminotransferase class V-fold PLP-dependent enzyme [Cyclobacteriaceae bacterium]
MQKREFLKGLTGLGLSTPLTFNHLDALMASIGHLSDDALATHEDFWLKIRADYRLKSDYINLENGFYGIMPKYIEDHYIDHLREINFQGSYYMRTVQMENKKTSAARLAKMAGCLPEELIITRNTTESLNLIIQGQKWKKGDEAIMASQDYGAMRNQFRLMERRFEITVREVSIPNHPKNDEEIVALYESVITPKTQLLMVCHMVNITGQIMPVQKICDMAHRYGVRVVVDGAHAFGHIQFSIEDLHCDYYGTSLHKWLTVPLGAGFLYVKKDQIAGVWPLFAEDSRDPEDISRLNHVGTYPVHTDLAIINAIDYHHKIGGSRKEARLRYLQKYWTDQVRDLPRVVVNTPVESNRYCAIGNVGIETIEPADFAKQLLNDYQIWTVAINRPGVRG